MRLAGVFSLFFVVVAGFAADASAAKKFLESQSKRALEVLSFEPIEGSALYLLIVADKANGYRTPLISDEKQSNFTVASAFFSSNKEAMARVGRAINDVSSYNANVQQSAKLQALFRTIPDDSKVTITGGSKKILYIVTDPMCPHCQEELAQIESRLKTHTLVLIPLGLLGQESAYKSAEILRKMRSTTTPKEQIQVLRSIYSTAYQAPKISDDTYTQVLRVTSLIKDSRLIEGVPFLYEAL